MTPSVEGELRWFSEHGLYDGLFLRRDEETGTFWDHMTGDAVYGPDVGQSLEVQNLRQTTVDQILKEDRNALVALSNRELYSDADMRTENMIQRMRGGLNAFFSSTVEELVTVLAQRSDDYSYIPTLWAALAAFLVAASPRPAARRIIEAARRGSSSRAMRSISSQRGASSNQERRARGVVPRPP